MVMAADEPAARDYLSRERLGRLLWVADPQHLSELECDGDCFILSRKTPQAGSDPLAELRGLLDDARRAQIALEN
jgi:hypothetical protein